MREGLYQTLGYILRNVGGFPSCTALAPLWVSALTGHLQDLHSSHVRMLVRHIMLPLNKSCPLTGRQEILSTSLQLTFTRSPALLQQVTHLPDTLPCRFSMTRW